MFFRTFFFLFINTIFFSCCLLIHVHDTQELFTVSFDAFCEHRAHKHFRSFPLPFTHSFAHKPIHIIAAASHLQQCSKLDELFCRNANRLALWKVHMENHSKLNICMRTQADVVFFFCTKLMNFRLLWWSHLDLLSCRRTDRSPFLFSILCVRSRANQMNHREREKWPNFKW